MNRLPARPLHTVLLLVLPLVLTASGCSLLRGPTLAEQEAMILDRDIKLRALTIQAFLSTWGSPTYQDRQYTQFYPVQGGNWIPQFRVPLGELPPGWTVSIISKEGHFLGYPERGELLGFVRYELVYRERLSPEEIHAIGRSWAKSSRSRTLREQQLGRQR